MSFPKYSDMRPNSDKLLRFVEDGIIDKDKLITDLIGFMSEDEVKDFMRKNEYFIEEEDVDNVDENPDE